MTTPTEFPLLFLGDAEPGQQERLSGGPSAMRRPSRADQGSRLGPRVDAIASQMDREVARLRSDLPGVEPELVLVFEIAEHVDNFYGAVAEIPGLEFLLGMAEEVDGQGAFALLDKDGDDASTYVPGTAFLVVTNQEALHQVQRLWALHQDPAKPRFPKGFGPWRQLFDLLVDVREWGPQDRIRGTGIVEDFQARLEAEPTRVRAELELWYRSDNTARTAAERAVRAAVEDSGGEVVKAAVVGEIAYHAMLVELPVEAARAVVNNRPQDVALFRAKNVAFLRPQAQTRFEVVDISDLPTGVASPAEGVGPDDALVAVLDGVPLVTHERLVGRVVLDDPDELEGLATVEQRQHGTAVAGVVLHGDLAQPTEGPRTIYHRPILVPSRDARGLLVESFSQDELPVDLLHRAVLRLVAGDASGPARAPRVRIVNLSLGDESSQLGTAMSPLARLVDWLAYKYRLLFLISAGNYWTPLGLGMSLADWRSLSEDEARRATLGALASGVLNRRLLSPSESVNAVTVGALHCDQAETGPAGSRVDLLPGASTGMDSVPSPLTATGGGFGRSVKPDLTAPGGRLWHRQEPNSVGSEARMEPAHSPAVGPGIRVASPAVGSPASEAFAVGTSVSTAMASHQAGAIAAALLAGDEPMPEEFLAVAVKALLCHGCALGVGADELTSVWPDGALPKTPRHASTRFLGYGPLREQPLVEGATDRVTMLGYGELTPGVSARYVIPMPPSLGGRVLARTITITAASLVPVDPRHRQHRAARTYFLPTSDLHSLRRVGADWQSVRNGTLQHEVLSGHHAVPYRDGSTYEVAVSCRAVPEGRIGVGAIPYAIAFTLDVPGADVPIYAEVATRLRARIRARAQASVRPPA